MIYLNTLINMILTSKLYFSSLSSRGTKDTVALVLKNNFLNSKKVSGARASDGKLRLSVGKFLLRPKYSVLGMVQGDEAAS